MTSSDRIEQLKQQIRETSNQQRKLQEQKEKVQELAFEKKQEYQQNQREMTEFIRTVFGQSELMAAKERELLKDTLDKFYHSQNVTNEQLIALNDNLADTASLKAIYEAKRDHLEWDYQQEKMTLRGQLNELEKRIENQQDKIASLDKEIESKKEENFLIEERLKNRKFLEKMKKTWLDYWMPMITAGFMAVFLGGFFGWGTYGIANEFFKGIVHLIKG